MPRCWDHVLSWKGLLRLTDGAHASMAVLRERMQAAKAVDMVDHADALTTYPQQLQQTESLAA